MLIRDLDAQRAEPNVIILQTPSTRLQIFIEDKIKRKYECNADTIITLETKKDLKTVKTLMHVYPPRGLRWFVRVNLDDCDMKTLISYIHESVSCVFFCTSSRYKDYKTLKEGIADVDEVYDFYLTYLRQTDFLYLYDAFVPQENRLEKKFYDFISQGYRGDIEALFTLFLHLAEGGEIKSRNDIIKLCGLGGLTVDSVIFSLLKPLSGSDKGLRLVIKNRMQAGVELARDLGYSTLYNFISANLTSMIQLKQLLITGKIYKRIENLPEYCDDKKLGRYQRYIWKLKEIPLSDMLAFKYFMGNEVWVNELDYMMFLYRYYSDKAKHLLQ